MWRGTDVRLHCGFLNMCGPILPPSCTGTGASISQPLDTGYSELQILEVGDPNVDFTLTHKGCAVCSCEKGTAGTGPSCPAQDAPFCVACDPGFHLSGGSCLPNECTCTNGEGGGFLNLAHPCECKRGPMSSLPIPSATLNLIQQP